MWLDILRKSTRNNVRAKVANKVIKRQIKTIRRKDKQEKEGKRDKKKKRLPTNQRTAEQERGRETVCGACENCTCIPHRGRKEKSMICDAVVYEYITS